MHNAAYAVLGLDAVYVAVDAEPSALPHLLRGFEAVGMCGNVTLPHKIQAANLLFRKTDIATTLEAVNTFWSDGNRLVGDNTDVAGVLDALDHLDAATHYVANHNAIRLYIQLCGIKAFMYFDAEFFELRTHGRIDVAIASCDTMSRCPGQCSDAAHERAADSEYVYVHAAFRAPESLLT